MPDVDVKSFKIAYRSAVSHTESDSTESDSSSCSSESENCLPYGWRKTQRTAEPF